MTLWLEFIIGQDLGRRDDMWSFYFVILDFLNETLPWRNCKDNKVDEVRDVKARCLENPDELLWKTTTFGVEEIKNIFYSISGLGYADRPNYEYIRQQLVQLLQKEENKERGIESKTTMTTVLFLLFPQHNQTAQRRRRRPFNVEEDKGSHNEHQQADIEPPPAKFATPSPRMVPQPAPSAYLPPSRYMMPTPTPYSYYAFPHTRPQYVSPPQLMMGNFLGPHKDEDNNKPPSLHFEEEPQQQAYYSNVFLPPSPFPHEDYYKYYQPQPYHYPPHSGYCLPGNDCIQVVRPNIININNVNAMGNALIISGTSAQTPGANLPPAKAEEEKKKPQVENEIASPKKEGCGFFKVDVDLEYYHKRYSIVADKPQQARSQNGIIPIQLLIL
eukprot:TRINITY_DN161_c0_g2_i8.p2 TRINITY_DN161_c0_g2~~TRINITY_DN161_c0_g2_i8.p2  ORF type:complete len:386 (+),score=13.43 TRINITY_DN161_c0_g2_i8:911-2068(+)